jgi:acyl-CoA thioesterase I
MNFRKILPALFTLLLLLPSCSKPPAERGHKKILVLGDSITEGHGLEAAKVFPAVLERLIREKGFPDVTVTPDGVNGSTSESGLERLNARMVSEKYDILVLELGANDGLKGKDLAATRRNLTGMIARAKESGCQVLLAGMRVPAINGLEYSKGFREMFPQLAEEQQVRLIPFLLKTVAGKPRLNLDGVHPNEEGHKLVAEMVFKYLEPML